MSNGTVGTAVMSAAKSPFERLVGVFINPRETLEDVAARPSFWIPLIALCVVVILNGILLLEINMEYGLEKMRNMSFVTPEIMAKAEEDMQQALNSPWRFTRALYGPIIFVIFWIVTAAAFMFGGNVIMGGEAKYKTVFSVIAWAGLIWVLEVIVKTPLMLSQRTPEIYMSLATLLGGDDNTTFFYRLLNRFDIFTIWQLFVYTLGVAAIYKFSNGKASTVVVGAWVVYNIIYLTIAQLFGGFFGM
jgi:hypothetical protein